MFVFSQRFFFIFKKYFLRTRQYIFADTTSIKILLNPRNRDRRCITGYKIVYFAQQKKHEEH